MEFHFFALAAHGTGISGGDRIFMELARRWGKKYAVYLYLTEEGREMCLRNNVKIKNQKYTRQQDKSKLQFKISKIGKWSKFDFAINYLARIIGGIRGGLTINLATNYDLQTTYIYSASDFWMDVFPCVLLKIRNPKAKWVAGWYQTAPSPLQGYQGGRYRLSALLYYFSQLPIKPLVSRFADFVFVNNEDERKQFSRLNKRGKVFVLLGAVDLEKIRQWKLENKKSLSLRDGKLAKVFDAVFQGRFHPQKGVVELIDIWEKVVEKKPDSKLAMIGDGPLMKEVKSQIAKYKLQNNIKLFGYLFDGPEKYKIFSQSNIVVHPAFYDSGGMASAEAMAFGLPCVGFDLPAYKSYYPKGMVKVKLGDKSAFAQAILTLLKNKGLKNKIASEAVKMIKTNWSWDKRAREMLQNIWV